MGFESLASHYWCLLGKLTLTTRYFGDPSLRNMEVMRSLEEAEEWEKLEVWMVVVWKSLRPSDILMSKSMEGIERVTLTLSLRQPSALQRFENLLERDMIPESYKPKLQGICDWARTERLHLEPPPPSYVSVHLTRRLSVLMPPFFSSVNRFKPIHQFSFLFWETTPSECLLHTPRAYVQKFGMRAYF